MYVMDFFFNSDSLLPLAVVVIYVILWRRPLPVLNFPTADLGMTFDALKYEIDYLLETLFEEILVATLSSFPSLLISDRQLRI